MTHPNNLQLPLFRLYQGCHSDNIPIYHSWSDIVDTKIKKQTNVKIGDIKIKQISENSFFSANCLNLNINNVRNLFSQIELPYEIDCYICVCGHNEIIIKGQNSILEKYTCIHCENTNFYNANVLNKDRKSVV